MNAPSAGATCDVKYPGHPTEGSKGIWDFIVEQLRRLIEQTLDLVALR